MNMLDFCSYLVGSLVVAFDEDTGILVEWNRGASFNVWCIYDDCATNTDVRTNYEIHNDEDALAYGADILDDILSDEDDEDDEDEDEDDDADD